MFPYKIYNTLTPKQKKDKAYISECLAAVRHQRNVRIKDLDRLYKDDYTDLTDEFGVELMDKIIRDETKPYNIEIGLLKKLLR